MRLQVRKTLQCFKLPHDVNCRPNRKKSHFNIVVHVQRFFPVRMQQHLELLSGNPSSVFRVLFFFDYADPQLQCDCGLPARTAEADRSRKVVCYNTKFGCFPGRKVHRVEFTEAVRRNFVRSFERELNLIHCNWFSEIRFGSKNGRHCREKDKLVTRFNEENT